MAQPLARKTVWSRQADLKRRVRHEERKPNLPSPYIYVSGGTGDVSPVATWQSPEWKNDFMWYGDSYVGFRHGLDGYTEYIGRIDLTLGAVTGTVAFTLPLAFRALTFDFTFPIFVETTTWQVGVLSTDTATGDVTVYWPVEATAI